MKKQSVFSPQCFSILLTVLTLFVSPLMAQDRGGDRGGSGRGGSFGGGGLTYTSGFEEARQIAASIVKSVIRPKGLSEELQNIYVQKHDRWLKALQTFNWGKSNERLFIDEVGGRKEKAGVANIPTFSVDINVPFLEENKVTLYQLIVLVVHEAGHLAEVMISHEQLDEIGIAIANANLLNQDGILIVRAPSEEPLRFLSVGFSKSGFAVDEASLLRSELDWRVIGQESAKKSIAANFRNGRPKILVFMGPFGVGKTLVSELIAEKLKMHFHVFPMAMYHDTNLVNLLGITSQYVGHHPAGGELARLTKSQPSSVIVFDEVEKASLEALKTIFDFDENDEIIDRSNTRVNFSDSILILTTDFGADMVTAYDRKYRGVPADADERGLKYSGKIPLDEMELRKMLFAKLQNSPEVRDSFGSRISIDNIIVFHHYDLEERKQVVIQEVRRATRPFEIPGAAVEVDVSVIEHLEKSFRLWHGNGRLRKLAERLITEPITSELLKNDITNYTKIKVKYDGRSQVTITP